MANGDVYKFKVLSAKNDESGKHPVLTLAGVFKFDGRLKAGQTGDFTYVSDPAQNPDSKPAWHVIVNRRGNVIRRNMKACEQRDVMTVRLKMLCDEYVSNLGEEHLHTDEYDNVYTIDNEVPKVEMAAISSKKKTVVLSDIVQKVIDDTRKEIPKKIPAPSAHADPLEIPDFLKRTQ